MNGSRHVKSVLQAVVTGLMVALTACNSGPATPRADTAANAAATAQTASAGEVALDSATLTVNAHWLTDSNIVALIGLVDQRQQDLAHLELQSWASDTVQNLATGMLHAYAAQQQSLDSLSGALHVRPSLPAVGVALDTTLQQRAASLQGLGAVRLDSAFLETAAAQDEWAASYLDQLSTVATSPDLAAFASKAANRATLQLNGIRQYVAMRAGPPKDSTQKADSARLARARARARAGTGQ